MRTARFDRQAGLNLLAKPNGGDNQARE